MFLPLVYRLIYHFLFFSANDTGSPIQVALEIGSTVVGFSSALSVTATSFIAAQLISVSVYRSFTTRFFSVFIIFTMWCLSGSVLILAITLWTRDRKVEPPTIAVVCGMLFALPAVRNGISLKKVQNVL